jgi:hypothetical protein
MVSLRRLLDFVEIYVNAARKISGAFLNFTPKSSQGLTAFNSVVFVLMILPPFLIMALVGLFHRQFNLFNPSCHWLLWQSRILTL